MIFALTDSQSIVTIMTTRSVKAPEERRSELIAAAQRLFYTRGYNNTSVSDIVRDVGVAQGTFYYYFDSKTAVLRALVEEMVADSQVMLHEIVVDESLSAIPKWQQVIKTASGWKLERKEQMLAVNRMLFMEENFLLRHTLITASSKMIARELALIIAQGVEEAVFDTGQPLETAEMVMALIFSLSDGISELIFSSLDPTDDQVSRVMRRIMAVQTGIERLLGAPPGSLPIMDEETLRAWVD